jgi:hypothetical protein
LTRLQAAQVLDGTLCTGGREDRALVLLEDSKPTRQIRGVVVPNFERDAKLGAQEGGTQLRHQFLEGVGCGTESLPAEFPRAAGGGWPVQ